MDRINQYITDLFAPEDEVLRWIEAQSKKHNLPGISIYPYEGRLLQFLIESSGAKKVLEIGTLAGYSGVWMARGLPPEGKLYTIEKSTKHAAIAREAFSLAGIDNQVTLVQGSAEDVLPKLATQAPFDFVFIDADKSVYEYCLEWAIQNTSKGATIAAHNAIRGGRVLEPQLEMDHQIAQFNQRLADHPQLSGFIISVGDGMAVAVRK